jgi:hypothetical protein
MTCYDTTCRAVFLGGQGVDFLREGPPSRKERRRDLKKLKTALLAREDDFAAALDQDFGHRSKEESLLFDVASTVASINYLHRNLARFMRSEHRDVAMIFRPARNRVIYLPRGVVGIVSPWNYPLGLALIPLATAIAAGNRVMLKPSEFVPATTELIASHHARGKRQSRSRHARARRQVAGDHRARLRLEHGGAPHRLRQTGEWRTDLRGAGLCARSGGRHRDFR